MTFTELREKWDEMPVRENGFFKLNIEHPLDLQIGYSLYGNKSFVVMDTGIIKNISSSVAVKVNNIQLRNKSWALEFLLSNPAYTEEFLRLCWDLIDYSSEKKDSLNALISRYMTWQKLLQYENKGIMSFQRQKGLLGELLYLLSIIDEIGIDLAIDSWTGPDGSDQDFQFSSNWVEIKSVSLASKVVPISSLEQLQQEKLGQLIIYTLESTNITSDNSISLVNIVEILKDKLINNAIYWDRFCLKLYKYGYRENQEAEYYKNQFRFIEKREYVVDDSFPKLIRMNVAPEIVSCKYEISLSAIEKYRR